MALNKLQWLMCHKTKPNQTKPWKHRYGEGFNCQLDDRVRILDENTNISLRTYTIKKGLNQYILRSGFPGVISRTDTATNLGEEKLWIQNNCAQLKDKSSWLDLLFSFVTSSVTFCLTFCSIAGGVDKWNQTFLRPKEYEFHFFSFLMHFV